MSAFYEFISSNINSNNHNVAIIDSELKKYTYAELYREIESSTHLLRSYSLSERDKLILKLDKSFKSLAILISCIRLGIVYIPVDVNTPDERLSKIIKSSAPKAILKEDFTIENVTNPNKYEFNNAVCVLYTSGSTGVPKGVVTSSEGLYDFVSWGIKELKLTSKDVFTAIAPYHFDLSTFDLFSGLATGASVWLIDQKLGGNFRLFGEYLKEVNPTVWYATPTVYTLLCQFGKLSSNYCPRVVLFAGEVFPIKSLNILREQWNKAIYYNLYGPTETNVCTYYKLPYQIESERKDPYPIGVECNFAKTKISDQNELWVAGSSVMVEYLNNPTDTEEKIEEDDGERWYKTGDMVHIENNFLCYKGRLDRMIKRKGYRIEPGEIESVLIRNRNIETAAIISINKDDNIQVICFYTGTKSSTIDLITYCSDKLLKYMIPDQFIHIEQLPISSNGKTDYKELIANFGRNE